MVMPNNQMFLRQPTMMTDPRTAIGVAQGGGLNAPTQTIGGIFGGGVLPPQFTPMSVNNDVYSTLPKNVTDDVIEDFSRRQLEFNQNNLNKYGGDLSQTFNAFTEANPNLNPHLVNEYRNMLGRGNDMIAFGNTGFDTTLPTQAPTGSTAFNPLTGIPSAPSSPSVGAVAGGAALGGLLSGNFDLQNILGTAGQAYLGQEAISAPYEVGRAGLELAEQVGQRGVEATAFKPYTVTSNLARVGTDPSGGFTTQLSPEQQAMQQQLMGQAGSLFGQVGADPATAQAQLYEQMRAVQRPEEQRQRLALEERMLSQGRLGLSSDAYGGSSPELLAQETARQEAMARANLGARQQSQAEMLQAGKLGGMLQAAGYQPQQQALNLLDASQISAGLQQTGQLAGADLQSELGAAGIESLLQGSKIAEANRLAQLQNLTASLAGRQDPTTGGFGGGLLGSILGGSQPASSTSSYGFLADMFDFGGANPSQINTGLMMGFTPDQIANALINPTSFEDNIDYSGSEYDY